MTEAIRELAANETVLAHEVMADLRPHHHAADAFVAQVNERQRPQGYRLAAAFVGDAPVAVTGFRVIENLASGRHLYVDDLVTRSELRGRGYGARLLAWLVEQARADDCNALHLDCGVHRHQAHRFYFTQGMRIGGYHFELAVADADARPRGAGTR